MTNREKRMFETNEKARLLYRSGEPITKEKICELLSFMVDGYVTFRESDSAFIERNPEVEVPEGFNKGYWFKPMGRLRWYKVIEKCDMPIFMEMLMDMFFLDIYEEYTLPFLEHISKIDKGE